MTRKGRIKVRTGCFTCKIRKVKCDEIKPNCYRCTSTGYHCDGYSKMVHMSVANRQPSHISLSFGPPDDDRAIEFFYLKAAPSLSKPYDPYFWTTLVLQLSNSEPAIRHAMIALSSVYEDFACKNLAIMQLKNNKFALRHYNAAIHKLIMVQDETLVLVACVLFVCIEVIQMNQKQAITHSKHAFEILKTIKATKTPTKYILAPIIRRLRTMPLFFGRIDLQQDIGNHEPVPNQISSISMGEDILEDLFLQIVSLIRSFDEYRYGKLRGQPVRSELLTAATKLQDSVEQLRMAFADINYHFLQFDGNNVQYLNFALRLEVCRLWASVRHDPEDMHYDQHNNGFRSIICHAERLSSVMELKSESTPERKVRFEFGLMPILCFVATRCRDLAIRLEALQLMKKCSATRESFCDLEKVYLRSRRIIEVEHNLVLNKLDQPIGSVLWRETPPADRRVHNIITEPYDLVRVKVDGKALVGRPEGFLMCKGGGRMYFRIEFIVVSSIHRHEAMQYVPLNNSILRPYIPLFDSALTRGDSR